LLMDHRDFDEEDVWQSRHPQTREAARLIVVERGLNIDLGDGDASRQIKRKPSLRRALVESVAEAAMNHAAKIGATPEEQLELSWPGLEVIDSIQFALVEVSDGYDNVRNANFWKHERVRQQPVVDLKCPFIRRDGVEEAATDYLRLPYRAPALERLLVDVLVATELYAFGNEMIARQRRFIDKMFPSQSPIHEESFLRTFIRQKAWGAAVCLGVAAAALVYGKSYIGDTAALWIAVISVGLYFVGLLFDTFMLPRRRRAQKERQAKVWSMFSAMNDVYLAMGAGGAISATRVRELATKAADIGVVWPGPLFAMLDDNIARGGVLM
jgi:hypothetical protein